MRKVGKYCLVSLFLVSGITIFGQLETNETIDEFQSVDIINSGGAITSNISFSGDPSQIGSFDGSSTNLGLEDGVLISTFNIEDAEGPNDKGVFSWTGGSWSWSDEDEDLNTLCQCSGNYSAAILEFDIVATGDTLNMNYVFASEEYKEEVCGQFNDVCGIFVSGPGISGPYTNNSKNIAVVPGSNAPVMTNTINGGVVGSGWSCESGICESFDPNWLDNTIYYFDNTGGTTVQFDGWTVPLQASTQVQSGQTYHLKIAVQNTSDAYFDSGIFLDSLYFSSTGCGFVDPNLPDTINFCAENETVTLDAGNPGFNFLWSPSSEFTQSIETQSPGLHTVEITGNGCPDVTYSIVLIDTCDCPFIDPNLPDSITFCPDSAIITLDAGNPGFEFLWSPGGEETQTIQPQVYGLQTVEITKIGCPDMTYSIMLIDSCQIIESPVLIVPNIFTPNGDGENDIFHLTCQNIQSQEGTIYNRWGSKMFSWSDNNGGWDGYTTTGTKASSGTYYYVVTILGIDHSEEIVTGWLQLIR